MKLNLFTIVLDGMPWIKYHLEALRATKLDWKWVIVEGTALPTQDTSWVAGIQPRLSIDGTTEYLRSIEDHRVVVIQRKAWANKTEMVNMAVAQFDSGILLQVDSDEIWSPDQLERMVDIFAHDPKIGGMRFFCRYFIGSDIITSEKDSYGNNSGEWMRAWRFKRGMLFNRHEPPILNKNMRLGSFMGRDRTAERGLVFDHMSWVTPDQVKFKCQYYGHAYANGFEGWSRLQKNTEWPVKLKQYMTWVDDNAIADKLRKDTDIRPVLGWRSGPDDGIVELVGGFGEVSQRESGVHLIPPNRNENPGKGDDLQVGDQIPDVRVEIEESPVGVADGAKRRRYGRFPRLTRKVKGG